MIIKSVTVAETSHVRIAPSKREKPANWGRRETEIDVVIAPTVKWVVRNLTVKKKLYIPRETKERITMIQGKRMDLYAVLIWKA